MSNNSVITSVHPSQIESTEILLLVDVRGRSISGEFDAPAPRQRAEFWQRALRASDSGNGVDDKFMRRLDTRVLGASVYVITVRINILKLTSTHNPCTCKNGRSS